MKVQIVEFVDAPLDRAWPVFSDFTALIGMAPKGTMTVQGSGVGALRTVRTPDGSSIQERLEALDASQHMFSYAVVNDSAALPFTNYLATVRLSAASGDRCEVDWSSVFEPRGDEEKIRQGMEAAYRSVIAYLGEKVVSGSEQGQI